MANYSAPVGARMAYDVDGTQVYTKPSTSGTPSQLTSGSVTSLNGEVASGVTVSAGSSVDSLLIFLFPQRRDITGYYAPSGSGWTAFEWSTTTTNGVDGSWSAVATSLPSVNSALVNPGYRTSQSSASALNVAAVRFRLTASGTTFTQLPHVVHLYGKLTTSSVDRLAFWHPTLSQELDYIDFQDITRGTTATPTFRVRNMSASLTANSVQVTTSVLTDASPSVGTQITYSSDNSTFTSTLSLGDLAPGAVSPTLYVRNSLLSTAALSLWAGRIKASATSFS